MSTIERSEVSRLHSMIQRNGLIVCQRQLLSIVRSARIPFQCVHRSPNRFPYWPVLIPRMSSLWCRNVTLSSRPGSRVERRSLALTMAKAVHFRSSMNGFILDGIDISCRFQHDWKTLREACLFLRRSVDQR